MSNTKVYPGTHPNVVVDQCIMEEKYIIRNLAEEFYITSGCRTLIIGQSEYRYLFLKFPDAKVAAYGVRDEIIVLLSPFENFEPRTLDAIEQIQIKNPGFRLDKICAFVISKDVEVTAKVDRIIKTQKESRIITPFSYGELLVKKTDEFFRDRIKKYFFERNLFDFDSPLRKDLYFFGRENICQTLVDKHLSGQNAGLFGLRRSGKTSILLSVCRRLESQGGIATLIDCQMLHLGRWWNALYYIVNEINQTHTAKLMINRDAYTEVNAAQVFEQDILRLRKKFNKTMLVVLDEIEQITFDVSFSEHWRTGFDYVRFWHVLRSIFQRQDNPITFIIAGTNPRCIETPFVQSGDNPLFGQIRPEYIDGFTVPYTKQMVETLASYMGITIDEDIYAYLTREFGGHPFLIRQACSHIKSKLDENSHRHIDRLLYESAIKSFSDGVGDIFCKMVIGVLEEHYKDEYTMLTFLSRGDLKDFAALAESDPAYTRHLIGYGIIYKATSGFDFKVDAIKKYLLIKERYQRLNLTNADKLAEISARRNDAEHRLRKVVLQVLLATLGEASAKSLILAKHESRKRVKFEQLPLRDLFDPQKHEIYFDDLRELMRKNWESGFRNIFSEDVEKFNSRMILLNSIGRSDAHMKNVTDPDMQSFRGAMSWLEERIGAYLT